MVDGFAGLRWWRRGCSGASAAELKRRWIIGGGSQLRVGSVMLGLRRGRAKRQRSRVEVRLGPAGGGLRVRSSGIPGPRQRREDKGGGGEVRRRIEAAEKRLGLGGGGPLQRGSYSLDVVTSSLLSSRYPCGGDRRWLLSGGDVSRRGGDEHGQRWRGSRALRRDQGAAAGSGRRQGEQGPPHAWGLGEPGPRRG